MTSKKRKPQPTHDDPQAAAVEEIVRQGPRGAFAVAGVATAIVVAIFFLFYILVYLPRGAVQ
jgi:hypothetical protein